jgi:hypothetical protein
MVEELNGDLVGEECIMLKGREYPSLGFVHRYYDFSCYIKTCFECAFQQGTIFQILGLCHEQTLIMCEYVFITSLLPLVILSFCIFHKKLKKLFNLHLPSIFTYTVDIA